jgi:hypothetical protein
MEGINLPTYSLNIKSEHGKRLIFDPVRRKYVALTPEEYVRQNFIQYLNQERKYPLSLMSIEYSLTINTLSKRCDIVIFNRKGNPAMIVECKAPDQRLSQRTLEQIAAYNLGMKVDYLVLTNLNQSFACKMDYAAQLYEFIREIPDYGELSR